jgi:hypothetical protein
MTFFMKSLIKVYQPVMLIGLAGEFSTRFECSFTSFPLVSSVVFVFQVVVKLKCAMVY